MSRTLTRGREEDAMRAEREVRVRPGFAALYPELATDVWVSAREFAAVMVTRASQARRQGFHRRTLNPRHFEFRGSELEARPARARGRQDHSRPRER